jgi:hypothetical protein
LNRRLLRCERARAQRRDQGICLSGLLNRHFRVTAADRHTPPLTVACGTSVVRTRTSWPWSCTRRSGRRRRGEPPERSASTGGRAPVEVRGRPSSPHGGARRRDSGEGLGEDDGVARGVLQLGQTKLTRGHVVGVGGDASLAELIDYGTDVVNGDDDGGGGRAVRVPVDLQPAGRGNCSPRRVRARPDPTRFSSVERPPAMGVCKESPPVCAFQERATASRHP